MKQIGFLFDLDGVLIDSESEYTRIWERINVLFPTGVPEFATRIKGMTLTGILNTYYPDHSIHSQVKQCLYDQEMNMKYEWLPGARELLEFLSVHDIPSALVTSSNRDKMEHLQSELPDLESYFDAIVTGDMVSASKPDPEGYLLGASLIKVSSARCAVFEDSLQGVKAGESAGAFVVGMAGTLPKHIIAPHSNIVIHSMTHLNKDALIATLNSR